MYRQLRPGNLVNLCSGCPEHWVTNHIVSKNDIIAISAGINKAKGIPVTLNWKIKFYQNSGDAIPLDTVKYVHELQNHYFKLFGTELVLN